MHCQLHIANIFFHSPNPTVEQDSPHTTYYIHGYLVKNDDIQTFKMATSCCRQSLSTLLPPHIAHISHISKIVKRSFQPGPRSMLTLVSLQFFFNSDGTDLVLAGAGALLFCGFIIYDTNLLMKQLSPEDYILASINLYLDIVTLFLHILRLLDSVKKH